ncbi:unnamed protein product [Adineta steineri]|uniref:Uncharacterized protein n=1 Tax=Adineta steineri TaxID=433720 RepID=A0A818WQE2_9BILA|nr:unnamed protein product [Adineta steineri]
MVHEKRRFFSLFPSWHFTAETIQWPVLVLVAVVIFIILMIAVICERFHKLFCCHNCSQLDDQERIQISTEPKSSVGTIQSLNASLLSL